MTRLVPSVAACLALLLAGCGVLPFGPDTPVRGAPPVRGPAAPGIDEPAARSLRVGPEGGMLDARPVAVERFLVGPDGRTVVIEWWGGVEACFGLDRVELDAPGDAPRLTAWEGTRPEAAGRACEAMAVRKSAVVVLDAPVLADGSGQQPAPGEPQLGGGAEPVAPEPDVENARPHAIHGFEVTPDGRTLTVHYVGGVAGCHALAAVEVTDVDGLLAVLVLEGARRDQGEVACPDLGVAKVVTVDAPRAIVVDGSADEG